MTRFFTLLLILIFSIVNSFACTCGNKASVDQAYKNSEIIVSIKVLSIINPESLNDTLINQKGDTLIGTPLNGFSKTAEVISVHKGKKVADTLIIRGIKGNCELYLQVGEEYLIYGRIENGEIITDKCTRSGKLQNHPDLIFFEKKNIK